MSERYVSGKKFGKLTFFSGISKPLLQPPNVRNALLNTDFLSHILIRMLLDRSLLEIMKLFIGALDARYFQMNKLYLGCALAA